MQRIILALILAFSTFLPAREHAPDTINAVKRGMHATGCIPPTGETAGDAKETRQ